MRDLVLTGFMGTGKSTVAATLAHRFGWELLDTDDVVEQLAGKSIPAIFAEDGEAEFRRLELHVLGNLRGGGGRIVATGGGALINPEARAILDGDQPVVCLTCSLDELRARLAGGSARPLLDSPDAFRRLQEQRAPIYAEFKQVDTSNRTPYEVADTIAGLFPLAELQSVTVTRTLTSRLIFGRGAIANVEPGAAQVVLVTDQNVATAGHLAVLERTLKEQGTLFHTVVLPPGEETKSLACLEELYRECLSFGLERSGMIIALGGGVVCDLAGMLAATYKRGVRFISVPTTLLAQVDAAIGGKVGLDVCGVKNAAGTFYPAEHVVIDPDLLRTMSPRLLSDGLAEIVKIAVMRSKDLLQMIEELQGPEEVRDRINIIRTAVALKADLVAMDPYEQGDRALLNFGHTVGHALESAADFHFSHGDAVAAGMVAEAWLAESSGRCDSGMRDRVAALLSRLGLPLSTPGLDAGTVYEHMLNDKKREAARHRFALPVGPGEGRVFEVDDAEARAAIAYAVGGTS